MPNLLLDETREFSERQFFTDYQQLDWTDQTLRHIGHHIIKAGYKLVAAKEGTIPADVVITEVIPDLAIYRSQIIDLLGFDPDEIDWEAHAEEAVDVAHAVLWSAGVIARYIEPLEHEVSGRHENLRYRDLAEVPVRLHQAVAALADEHGVDLVEAQRDRMG